MTKKLTMTDIAEKAGMSRKSVYGILNKKEGIRVSDKARKKVLALAKELNYVPNHFAKSLRTGKTNTIGITSGSGTPVRQLFNDPYFSNLFTGIGDAAADNNYRVLIQQSKRDVSPEESLEMAMGNMADGIIFVLLSQQLKEFSEVQLPRLKKLGLPFVVAMTYVDTIDAPVAAMDARQGAYEATRHLAGHGYRNFGFLTYGGLHNPFNAAQFEGFSAALREVGADPEATTVLLSDNLDAAGGYTCMERFFDDGSGLPRAWFSVQSRVAEGAMAALGKRGVRVPEECAFASYGIELKDADIMSSLTLAPAPVIELGRNAGDMLFARINGEETENVVLKPALKIRTSCGCH